MPADWVANVRKYSPDADEAAIAGIVQACGPGRQDDPDGAWVSLGDPAERIRLREQFLKAQLGLTAPDEQLDAGIEVVGRRLQGEARPDWVTVYYLLAEHFGQLQQFVAPDPDAVHAAAQDPTPEHLSLHSAGSAALGAAGEAVAFLAGAPIAGAADSAIVLGESLAEREERLEEAVTGTHSPRAARSSFNRWAWLVIAVVIVAIWLFVARR